MKRAFIVTGPEASGTKLVTQLLANHGCHGQEQGPVGNEQWILRAIDKGLDFESDPIVLRLSIPHGGKWHDIHDMIWHLHCLGYKALTLVTVRDCYANMSSQAHNDTHALNAAHSDWKIQKAYRLIFEGLCATATPFIMVPYESLIMRPRLAMGKLVSWCGLVFNVEKCPDVHDANQKWYDSP